MRNSIASRTLFGGFSRWRWLFTGIGLVTGAPVIVALWLILAAVPALADGGPHVMTSNNGSLGLSADGCAGCHRAHTAQGPYLINAADETSLCKTCHGAVATGSTVDVMTGVQYSLRGADGIGGTQLGALRGGGFAQARIDAGNAARRAYGSVPDFLAKVPVGPALDATSAHLDADDGNGVVASGIAWGNGDNSTGAGAGATVDLSCTSCHNPHGNGQYRTLNPIPNPAATSGFFAPVGAPGAPVTDSPVNNPATGTQDPRNYTILQVKGTSLVDISYLLYASQVQAAAAAGTFRVVAGIASSDATTEQITTTSAHGFAIGNSVTITGHDAVATPAINGTYTIATVPSVTTFTLTGVNITTGGTTLGTVTKNTGAIPGDYGPLGGDYFHRYVPWNATAAGSRANDAPNGRPNTFSTQMTAWCTACHTRYNSSDPFTPRTDALGAEEPIFKYQHQTVSGGAFCTTCHVSHGSNAVMGGTYSATMPFPDGAVKLVPSSTTVVPDSRLLKFPNRGTCQACHDPTHTIVAGAYTGPTPTPGVP